MKVLQLKPLVGSLETERRETDTMYNMVAHQVERLVHYLVSNVHTICPFTSTCAKESSHMRLYCCLIATTSPSSQ